MSPLIRIYGFDGCPYCATAVNAVLLTDYDLDYVKIHSREERTAFLDEREFAGQGQRTFPRVYQVSGTTGDEILIGGCDDLLDFLDSHSL